MKILTNNLIRSLILEQVDELFSTEEEDSTRLSLDSVDDQIDSFIIKFERDSVVSDNEKESDSLDESLRMLSLKILMEQDEVEEEEEEDVDIEDEPLEDEPAEEEEEDVEDPEPAGSEDVEADAPEVTPKLPLDVDAFTKRIARLAMNSEKLLDVKTTVINRAMNFIIDNYDQAHVDKMKEILDSQFDFNLDGGKDIPEPPYAVGAYAGGTGGLGGGGGG